MNNVGKIFITLIFLLSVMFMSFTLVLYATHQNWKEEHAKVKKQLDEANARLAKEETTRNDLTKAYEAEVERGAQRIVALQEDVKLLQEEKQTLAEAKTKLEDDQQKHIEMVKLAHDSLAASRTELEGLRKDNRTLHEDWDRVFHKLVEQTDIAHDLALKLANYRSVGEQLAKDFRNACEVLRKFGLQADPDVYSGVPPKNVEGLVTEVRPDGWLEISIGEDSGIREGHQLDVYRQANGRSAYIGKVKVVQTQPDRAACVVMPEFRKGTIQREDSVGSISLTN